MCSLSHYLFFFLYVNRPLDLYYFPSSPKWSFKLDSKCFPVIILNIETNHIFSAFGVLYIPFYKYRYMILYKLGGFNLSSKLFLSKFNAGWIFIGRPKQLFEVSLRLFLHKLSYENPWTTFRPNDVYIFCLKDYFYHLYFYKFLKTII